jgi:ribosomal protein L7/L12
MPMSDGYSSNRAHYQALKAEILEFLHIENSEASSSSVGDENSIQSLLKQGRKIDAIQLVRASQEIGLTEAVERVNELDAKMKAAK